MRTSDSGEIFKISNIRYFIRFRLFFNARFYYPVFTILFIDFGLSLEQFALLNVVWAATIVLLEVPSGALADTMGRRNLLVLAAGLMVAEMALLSFVPRGNVHLLFAAFLLNRVLSGTAEAAASGADEALAFDSLKQAGQERQWGRVLDRQMRVQSMGYMLAMSMGAAVYDPYMMQKTADWLGLHVVLTQDITLRFPIYLTLLMALLALMTTLGMDETRPPNDTAACRDLKSCGHSARQAFGVTFQAGRWILKTPIALVIIAGGVLFDNIIRMVLTLSSQYYRLIQLPEATFGLIGSGLALMGLLAPRVALKLVERRTPAFNMALLAGLTFCGLLGMTFFIPRLGLLPMVFLYSAMLMMGFMLSYYLNRITASEQRATVLSFKGLSFNLGYGIAGLLYALLVAMTKSGLTDIRVGGKVLEDLAFKASLGWFPWYFLFTLALWFFFASRKLHLSDMQQIR